MIIPISLEVNVQMNFAISTCSLNTGHTVFLDVIHAFYKLYYVQ